MTDLFYRPTEAEATVRFCLLKASCGSAESRRETSAEGTLFPS